MKALDLPFNVELMKLTTERLQTLKPVTSLDYFENANGDLHEDGLFSISIFGRIGDEARDRRFSFIDIRVPIFHPVIYSRLVKLKGLYRGILAGTHYATWNPEIGDFESADELTGQTGYAFFIQHWKQIQFNRNKSGIRDMRIALIEKYRDRALTDKILVIPAGLRDIQVDEAGQTKEAEINGLYRRVLSIARTISPSDTASTSQALNLPRHLLQLAFNEIYAMLENMLTGKKGMIQAKWASRRIFNGTRNVITAMDTSREFLGGENAPKYTDTVIGLYQASKALLPVAIRALKTGYLEEVFGVGGGQARLIDPKTLRSELVTLPSDAYDRWTTVEGLEKVISSYAEVSLRDRPVKVAGRYLALIYAPPADPSAPGTQVFKVFHGMEDFPENLNPKYVRPINLVELLYLSGYHLWNKYAAFVTRYPVTGVDSCYASTLYIKTTVVGEMRRELDLNWEVTDDPSQVALEFPTYSPLAYLDSQVIPSARLKGLGADQSVHYSGN